MSEMKMYYYRGEKVSLLKNVADHFGVSVGTVQNCISRMENTSLGRLEEGRDYYHLSDKELKRFKKENGMQHSRVSRLQVVTMEGIEKLEKNPSILIGRATNLSYVGVKYFKALEMAIPVYEMRSDI